MLETLLADPAVGGSAAPEPAESPLPATGLGLPLLESAMGSGADPDAPPARPRPPSEGAKASERILALLSGEGGPSAAERPGQFAEFDPGRLSAESAAPPPPPEPPAAAPARPAPQGGVLRKPVVIFSIGAVLVLVVILVLALTSGGGKHQADNVAYVTAAPGPPTSAAQPVTPTAAASSTLTVKSASSHCPAGSTPGMDAFGGPGKAWTCVRAYKVDGQVLTLDLGHTYQIDSIGIVPGWDQVGTDGIDQWTKYRTVSRVSYQFDDTDTTTYTQQTLDQRQLVVTKLSPPVTASKIVLTVLASKGDPTINTVAISSIVITGH
ncbi:hypothetical protein EBN03_25890 [Nocardia stercoris]|uniref:Discoidin domain-containing protein n=1 Tax=Nocardia stercoris TaxID=2483361 RepID=A0A3M2L4Q8_9NOCA|nr:hypothetical protein EBN03_25890 [Nocardia stercoris]